MTREKIIDDLIWLGEVFGESAGRGSSNEAAARFQGTFGMAGQKNAWFTRDNICTAAAAWAGNLNRVDLEEWLSAYPIKSPSKTVALIMAGNIPFVGLHDLICVLLSGNKALVKTASDDDVLMTAVIGLLYERDPEYRSIVTKAAGPLKGFDAAIATGSDNSARYFEYYFGKYPHIIRKNRTSVAVIKGNERSADLFNLGKDVFTYFGMGCRNVSHLLVPEGYEFSMFYEAIYPLGEVINHNKYINNHDYHKAIFLLEQIPFLDNNFLMLRQSDELFSPLSVLHYSYYETEDDITNYILDHNSKIQCVVGKDYLPFGQAQQPGLKDYADGVDTMSFLLEL